MSTDPKHREPEEPASDSLDGDRPTLPVEIGPDELPMELDSPEAIGPYRIVEVLGEGGMGVVYRGHQSEPFDREVAVKVIKAGMDTKEVLRRFDLERRTLAKLQHEGIAQVLDAGSTDDGRPYFVMECAIGLPITDYCDRERSSIRDRLLLFVEVCRALQHAHQRGILHRDIKPSNVLVVEREGRAVPKVIDFGLARATSREEDGETTMTQAGQILGTPAYMSPEQAGSGASDVDSRTDIYSLGVVLFRLLTGRLPFGNRLRMASIRDLQKILLEEDPERPSSTIDSHGHRDLRVAELRRETPRGLARRLRGDLDWIVLRAIARERDRRYASVSELIADIERALAGERVLAGPDSSWYRIRSFTRRHRIAVVTGSLVLSAILVGGILAGWQAVRASRSERAAQRSALSERTLRLEAEKARQESDRLRLEAEQSRSEALEARSDAEASRDRAREAAAAQEAINQFLLDMFEVANTRNLGPEAKIIDALAWSTKEIPERFSGRPRIAASLHGTIGNTYRSLAQLEKAEAAHLAAVALRRELGEKVPLAAALNSLAVDYRQLGRFEDAQKAYEESLSLTEGATDEEALSFRALATFNQAQLYTALGQPELAEPLLEESLAIHEEIYPDDAEKQGLMLASLGRLAKARGRFDEGVPIMERSVEQFRKAYDRPHPYLAVALNDLGIAYSDVERHGDALECFTEALEIGEQTLGPTHPHLAMYLNNRASAALNQEGSLEDAEADLSRAMELAGEGGSAATFQIAASLKLQGSIFIRQAKVKEAEQALRRALTALDGRVPPRDDLLLECQSLLGQSLTLQGQYEEAEPLLLRMLEGPPGEVLPPEMVRLGYRRVVEFYSRRGDVERAEEWRKKRDADPLLR